MLLNWQGTSCFLTSKAEGTALVSSNMKRHRQISISLVHFCGPIKKSLAKILRKDRDSFPSTVLFVTLHFLLLQDPNQSWHEAWIHFALGTFAH